MDPCSALGEPDSTDETGLRKDNWSFSGNPQYWWMNKSARRYQYGNGIYSTPVPAQCANSNTPQTLCGDGSAEVAGNSANGLQFNCLVNYDLCWQIDGTPVTGAYGPPAEEDYACESGCEKNCSYNGEPYGVFVRSCLPRKSQL